MVNVKPFIKWVGGKSQLIEQLDAQLQETNQTLNFFCDFDKIADNIDNIKLSLCMLNNLIGATDLRKNVEMIWNSDSSALWIFLLQ